MSSAPSCCCRWFDGHLGGWFTDQESWQGSGQTIKTMQLYSDIDRIENELREIGIAAGGAVTVEQLNKFDSLHYEGNDAVDAAAAFIGLSRAAAAGGLESNERVLDVGSGLGGPARYLASQFRCRVTALELQSDVHGKAKELTMRAGLDDDVEHVNDDFLSVALAGLGPGPGGYDAVTSWLVFLHIPDKATLLSKCAEMLRPGGKMYVEDFYRIGPPFSEAEARSLKVDVYCEKLSTREQYVTTCEGAGFEEVEFEDKTADWTAFVCERLVAFRAGRERFERVHSDATYAKLLHFYEAVERLFRGGHLGGVRLKATKKPYEDTTM